jgi:8-oxo-dGTP pyrophosphatase MutT (NUDIX family)
MKIDPFLLKHILRHSEPPAPSSEMTSRPASVMLLLTRHNTQTSIQTIRKTDNYGYFWRNQMALPGGHLDPEDRSSKEAAFRELEEELDIHPDQVDYIGRLGTFQTRLSHKNVDTFIGYIDHQVPITIDPFEIAETFQVPISCLFETHMACNFHDRKPSVDELKYPYQEFTIWGLTARIIHYFIEILYPYLEEIRI